MNNLGLPGNQEPRPRSPIQEPPLWIQDLEPEEPLDNMAQAQPDNPIDALRALQDQFMQLQQQLVQQNNTITQQQQQIQALPRAPQPPPPARIKPDRPPPFSGRKLESLEAWIFQMDQYCQIAPVPVEERILFAATFFKDQAALWWRSYHQSINWDTAAPNWEEFLAALRQQFIPVNNSISAYDRLQRLSQKASVNAYNHEFRAIMLELPDMDQATRMNYYLRGLKDNLRPFVAMQQPQDLVAAETIAERVDSVTFKPQNRNAGFRPTPGYRAPGGVAPMDLDAISKLTPNERDRLRREGGCFRCRKKGHLARDCTMTNRTHPRINAMDTETTDKPDESGKE